MHTKLVSLEYGSGQVELHVPAQADILSLPRTAALPDPGAAVRDSLVYPIASLPLESLVKEKGAGATAVIVVSDNTRPVPYKGDASILVPLLDILQANAVRVITILVATGTHRALSEAELHALLPERAFAPGIEIVSHDCEDRSVLRHVGTTRRGTDAFLNTRYLDADIKILTGLVEPHFMAGFSGGRKSICPGIVSMETTHIFHGAALMADEHSDSFILDGNPCHEEALEIAQMAPPDFVVNVTINDAKAVTGVFAGGMVAAHRQAADKARTTNAVAIPHEYDVGITHAGFVGINHYQAAKAACEGVKAVRPGGVLLLMADHTDVHPVGGVNYRRVLPLLTAHGPEAFTEKLFAPDWTFVPEQWEVQMWARAMKKLGAPERLVYCAPQLTGVAFAENGIPGTDGGDPQQALRAILRRTPDARVAVLEDGPYGVPVLA